MTRVTSAVGTIDQLFGPLTRDEEEDVTPVYDAPEGAAAERMADWLLNRRAEVSATMLGAPTPE